MAGDVVDPARIRAVLAAAAVAFPDVPGVEVVDEGDLVRSFSAGRPAPYLNAIARLDLAADGLAERVRAVEAPYRAASVPTLWWVDDTARPADLRGLLEATGLREAGGEAVMVLPLSGWSAPVAAPDVTVRVVESIEDLDDWIAVIAGAYGWADRERADLMRGLYDPRLPHGRDPRRIQVLGLLGGVPAGGASLFRAAGEGWVTNVGTTPAARGRGGGAAMTVASLALAVERGDPAAWLAASAMGEPVYARLGFRTVGRLEHLVGPAPRP